jgi:uncharacterized protein YggE
MKNPWLKKNPFLSMWLSGANAVAGSARSRATAQGKRQAKALITSTNRQVANYWTEAFGLAPARPARKKAKRRRSS